MVAVFSVLQWSLTASHVILPLFVFHVFRGWLYLQAKANAHVLFGSGLTEQVYNVRVVPMTVILARQLEVAWAVIRFMISGNLTQIHTGVFRWLAIMNQIQLWVISVLQNVWHALPLQYAYHVNQGSTTMPQCQVVTHVLTTATPAMGLEIVWAATVQLIIGYYRWKIEARGAFQKMVFTKLLFKSAGNVTQDAQFAFQLQHV